jgi:hypothetical protein
MAAGIGIVTRLSSGVNQVVLLVSASRGRWASFRVAVVLLVRWGTAAVDRDGQDVRVNYVGGSAASLETLAAACFCR